MLISDSLDYPQSSITRPSRSSGAQLSAAESIKALRQTHLEGPAPPAPPRPPWKEHIQMQGGSGPRTCALCCD
ncbi:hypothetical protein AAFF_G00024570 [Aldrovandia affinis]|uniref:Uncharacterized protein n=1 Tax=Aldrovandia affinis TaxID=143900 RepID=A0AAD7T5S1_9TELE|nr:hypothetical protein AAFF_G00024570 [Aldrovandia affinis]